MTRWSLFASFIRKCTNIFKLVFTAWHYKKDTEALERVQRGTMKLGGVCSTSLMGSS